MAVLKLALILLHTHNLYEWSRWKYKTVEIGRERVHGMTTTDEPYYIKKGFQLANLYVVDKD